MSIFNLTDEKMKETSSTFTAHEIYQQPATWRKTCAQLAACKDELQAFIDQVDLCSATSRTGHELDSILAQP